MMPGRRGRPVSAGCCGLLMSATAFGHAVAAGDSLTDLPAPAPVIVVIAVTGAVLAGLWSRRAAAAAVLLTVAGIAIIGAAPESAAGAGIFATLYLLLRFAAADAPALTATSVVAAAGFGFVGVVAAAFPVSAPWVPLLAAPAAFACYALVVGPFLRQEPDIRPRR